MPSLFENTYVPKCAPGFASNLFRYIRPGLMSFKLACHHFPRMDLIIVQVLQWKMYLNIELYIHVLIVFGLIE